SPLLSLLSFSSGYGSRMGEIFALFRFCRKTATISTPLGLRDATPFESRRPFLRLQWTNGQRQPQSLQHAQHGAEFGVPARAESLVKTLSIEIGLLGNCGHPARAGNDADCVTHEFRITGFKRGGDIGCLPLYGVEIFGSIKARGCDHSPSSNAPAKALARLMSCCCV